MGSEQKAKQVHVSSLSLRIPPISPNEIEFPRPLLHSLMYKCTFAFNSHCTPNIIYILLFNKKIFLFKRKPDIIFRESNINM